MNKEELVSTIANDTKLTKKDINAVIDSTLKSIQSALLANEKITLVGFGTFEVRDRAAREGRNPKTGESLKIEAKKVPVFRAGKSLSDAISKKVDHKTSKVVDIKKKEKKTVVAKK